MWLDVLERQYIYIYGYGRQKQAAWENGIQRINRSAQDISQTRRKPNDPQANPKKTRRQFSVVPASFTEYAQHFFFLSQILSVLVSFRTVVFLQRLPLFTTLDQTNIATRWIWWHSRPADRANQIKQPIIKANEQSSSKWKASYFT